MHTSGTSFTTDDSYLKPAMYQRNWVYGFDRWGLISCGSSLAGREAGSVGDAGAKYNWETVAKGMEYISGLGMQRCSQKKKTFEIGYNVCSAWVQISPFITISQYITYFINVAGTHVT